jgi:hypothetical protein
MTDKEIGTAIAVACQKRFGIFPQSGDVFMLLDEEGIHIEDCDPLNDLNAMAVAETALSEYQDREYRAILINKTVCKEHRATARDKAEAFLRAVGGWP